MWICVCDVCTNSDVQQNLRRCLHLWKLTIHGNCLIRLANTLISISSRVNHFCNQTVSNFASCHQACTSQLLKSYWGVERIFVREQHFNFKIYFRSRHEVFVYCCKIPVYAYFAPSQEGRSRSLSSELPSISVSSDGWQNVYRRINCLHTWITLPWLRRTSFLIEYSCLHLPMSWLLFCSKPLSKIQI